MLMTVTQMLLAPIQKVHSLAAATMVIPEMVDCVWVCSPTILQFRERLSHRSIEAYAAMPNGNQQGCSK